ncbi:putative HTH-type transcriptional regulator [uncultured archaeon]|nr:putative HTH-type transcriptional regulator [uncultured archaeon]
MSEKREETAESAGSKLQHIAAEMRLNAKDRKILKELEQNARLPASQIARRTGLSVESANYRLRNLMERGIVRRNYAMYDLPRMGYNIYRILLQLENMPAREEAELLEHLRNVPSALWVGTANGAWDMLTTVLARDVTEFNGIIEEILAKHGKHIRNKDITMTVLQTSEPPGHITGKETRIGYRTPPKEAADLDETDYRIMTLLYRDARMPTTDIAKSIGVSSDTVQYRIKKLTEDKMIKRFMCWMDRKLLGYQHYKVLIRLQFAANEQKKRLIAYCNNHPNIIFFASIIGSWDMEIDMDAKSAADFHAMMRDLRNEFSDIIRNYESVIIIDDYLCMPEFRPPAQGR